MPQLPDLPSLNIVGPCWSADVDVVELARPQRHWALRSLFLDTARGRQVAGVDNVFTPGTLLLLCRAREVRLTLDPAGQQLYRWVREITDPPAPLVTAEELRHSLDEGALNLLLVQADPAAWPAQSDGHLPQFVCQAGEIDLNTLVAASDQRALLLATLGMDLESPPGVLAATSSGLSIYGQIALRWQATIRGPFLVNRERPDPAPDLARYRVAPDLDRWSEVERTDLIRAWQKFSGYLNPGNPLSPPLTEPTTTARWVTLEVANPTAPPRLFWQIDIPANGMPLVALHFAPGEMSLLLSDQLPYDQRVPPASLARMLPVAVRMEDDQEGGLALVVEAGSPVDNAHASIEYSFSLPNGQAAGQPASESMTLHNLTVAYDTLQTARLLREDQGLSEPDRLGTVDAPPVLWGFMPLADGWAQLPFPNLTEQIYLDAEPDKSPQPPVVEPPQLQGAVSYGNSEADVLALNPDEQPWSITITDARSATGTWTLRRSGNDFQLEGIVLGLYNPDVAIGGLLWLSTGRPTAADALPDLGDWAAGLRSLPLHSPRTDRDRYPPLVLIQLNHMTFSARSQHGSAGELVSARLGAWSFSYVVDTGRIGGTKLLLPADAFSNPALVWRRHPYLPMIQVLPLTQSQTPLNYPGASRQLAPFELALDGDLPPTTKGRDWRFGVGPDDGETTSEASNDGVNGAAAWPRLISQATAAREWAASADLPLAALSLPGLIIEPGGNLAARLVDPTLGLPLQYRFDLPYMDEVHALARLPKTQSTGAAPQGQSNQGASNPLGRTDYADHWRQLAEQAALAAADAVAALDQNDGGHIARLVEPFAWPAQLIPELATYPGRLIIRDAGSPEPQIALAAEAALRGISGWFEPLTDGRTIRMVDPAHQTGTFHVEAGSMAAARTGADRFRDQRGLARGASTLQDDLIVTPLWLDQAGGTSKRYMLTSTKQAWHLQIDDTNGWQLWFRDLPICDGGFDRAWTHPPDAEINNPEATGQAYNALAGYEWRLMAKSVRRATDQGTDAAQAAGTRTAPLVFCSLHFYPLVLERVQMAENGSAEIHIAGRLQLPVEEPPRELEDLANAVRLIFTGAGGQFQVTGVQPVSQAIEWPFSSEGGEFGDAPRLIEGQVALVGEPGQPHVRVSSAMLQFYLFGVEWRLPVPDETLVFDSGTQTITSALQIAPSTNPLAPVAAMLRLDLATRRHAASLDIELRLGRNLNDSSGAGRAGLKATVRFQLLGEQAGVATIEAATLFDDLAIAGTAGLQLVAAEHTLQMAWRTYETSGPLQLLPGMTLLPGDAPGFAALTFAASAGNGQPDLQIQTATLEALLRSVWGASLQESPEQASLPLSRQQIFGSSAGNMAFGYTAEWRPGSDVWSEDFRLNGCIEVTSLISWPEELTTADETDTAILQLPATWATDQPRSFNHLRHTIRILLNQHAIAPQTLVMTAGESLYQLAEGATWTLLAVVEHCIAAVQLNDALDSMVRGDQHRWTCVQDVHVVRPASLIAAIDSYGGIEAHTLDPVLGIGPIGLAAEGYLRAGLGALLRTALAGLPPNMILVEVSAAHWIRRTPAEASTATLLQHLPGGSQRAVLSSLVDYGPSAGGAREWLLLIAPFLGRLQDTGLDHWDGAGVDARANPLAVDPLLVLRSADAASAPRLALALASRAGSTPLVQSVAALDTEAGRGLARLDPQSLEQSWLRLHTSPHEPQPTTLQSVVAALPDTPARLSRAAALQSLFGAARPPGILPPEDTRDHSRLAPQSVTDTRSNDGIQALYTFLERRGTVVRDLAGVDAALDLHIGGRASSTQWLPDGLLVSQSTTIRPATSASLIEACRSQNEITIECWVKPASANPSATGAIVSLIQKTATLAFELLQRAAASARPSSYEMRVRTSASPNDFVLSAVPAGIDPAQPVQIVFTRARSGDARLYLNGGLAATGAIPGNFDPWSLAAQFSLAGAAGKGQPWQGTFYLVAIYNRPLTADEVAQNYRARIDPNIYGWAVAGKLLGSGLFAAGSSGQAIRHSAATLLPARIEPDAPAEPNLAISPYLGIELHVHADAAQQQPRLVSAELLCISRAASALLPVASRLWETQDRNAAREAARAWAHEMHSQIAPDSPIAILRYRWLDTVSDPLDERDADLAVHYDFDTVMGLNQPAALARPAARLRSAAHELCFREGQYGGDQIPGAVEPFEMAPPQVSDFWPLYLTDRPWANQAWPWGLSAVGVDVHYAPAAQAHIGRHVEAEQSGGQASLRNPFTLWWQAPQHMVQYRSASGDSAPAAGLPPLFRAAAIRALLPTIPDPPLPDGAAITRSLSLPADGDAVITLLRRWQPVLPGALRYLITGVRPGVMFALRHQLIRSTVSDPATEPALVAAGVPVQHRMPRPVTLPANRAEALDSALLPWASAFTPRSTLLACASPIDEAFFAAAGDTAPRRLQLRLKQPLHGAISARWDGELAFEVRSDARDVTLDGWEIALALTGQQTSLAYGRPDRSTDGTYRWRPNDTDALKVLLNGTRPGDTLTISARVRPASQARGLTQMLTFTLRTVDITLPLPLAPMFIHFEDPEYNRRLLSRSVRASGSVRSVANGRAIVRTITMSADRSEYNADSPVALRYESDDPSWMLTARLLLRHVDSNGIARDVSLAAPLVLESGVLAQFSLLDIRYDGRRLTLLPGEMIECGLLLDDQPADLTVPLTIVAAPVTPAPEAAYALLRWQIIGGERQVECVRFAWAPAPERIELVSADDLSSGLVRRRAVFRWNDAVRPRTVEGYAIQKIAANGATHFPSLELPFDVPLSELPRVQLQIGVHSHIGVDMLLGPLAKPGDLRNDTNSSRVGT